MKKYEEVQKRPILSHGQLEQRDKVTFIYALVKFLGQRDVQLKKLLMRAFYRWQRFTILGSLGFALKEHRSNSSDNVLETNAKTLESFAAESREIQKLILEDTSNDRGMD